MTRSASKVSFWPRPSQAGQAPAGALKENSRGSISVMVKPETGQANLSENRILFGSVSPSSRVANSAVARPSASRRACSIESARRYSMPAFTTTRSTTTSMSWLNFLSRVGESSMA